MAVNQAQQTEEFLSLYNRRQRQIYAYIRVLLPNRDDAEEVFQETCIAFWRAFEDFEPGTDFTAWARQVARNRVLAFCKQRRRDRHVFHDEVVQTIADDVPVQPELLDARRTALAQCLKKLRPRDRQLIEQRYQQKTTTVELAERVGRPLNTVYKALGRIRRTLLVCIERTIATEGTPQ